MILVADSGSTKCDWLLCLPGATRESFRTMGFNPVFHTSDKVAEEILKHPELVKHSSAVTAVYFYGAGCSTSKRNKVISDALCKVFSNSNITVGHDMEGAAIATCGDKPGIACILGTGSNSCSFDGKLITKTQVSLGYILGDEASGAWFGKNLLKMLLYGELPEKITIALKSNHQVDLESVIDFVYKQQGANVFLASFMPTLSSMKTDAWVKQFIYHGFSTFITTHIKKYPDYQKVPVHFVGSIAYNFSEILSEVCNAHSIELGNITKSPVIAMADYFEHGINRIKEVEC